MRLRCVSLIIKGRALQDIESVWVVSGGPLGLGGGRLWIAAC